MATESDASESAQGRQPWYENHVRVLCFCEDLAVMRTAWRGGHPGRRFIACKDQKCNFFNWCDPPMCERAKVIIPGLLKKINKLEDESKKFEAQLNIANQKLNKQDRIVFVSVAVVGLICVMALVQFIF